MGVRRSGVTPTGLGFVLSGRLRQFSLDPQNPNVIAPGKIPRITPTPHMALKDGKPFMAWTTPGEDVQTQANLQVFFNVVHFGMDLQTAVEMPRFRSLHGPAPQFPQEMLKGQVRAEPVDADLPPNSFRLYSPLVLLAILLSGPRLIPGWPDMSTPLPFLITSLAALFTGKRINFFTSSKQTFGQAMNMIILFTGIGVLIQSMALTGVRGLIATITISLPRYILFSGFSIVGILLPGVLVTFGAAAVLGPPYILALQDLNSIILSSGAALIMGIGCLVPPTGIGGLFAMRAVGEERYLPIFKKCLIPAIVALVLGLLFMIYANEIGRIPGLRYVPSKGSY